MFVFLFEFDATLVIIINLRRSGCCTLPTGSKLSTWCCLDKLWIRHVSIKQAVEIWNSIDVCISVWLFGTTKGSLWEKTWERRSSQKRRGIRHQSGRKRIGLVPCPLFGGCTHETVILISYDSQIDGWSIKWLFESVNEQVKEIIINQGLGTLDNWPAGNSWG